MTTSQYCALGRAQRHRLMRILTTRAAVAVAVLGAASMLASMAVAAPASAQTDHLAGPHNPPRILSIPWSMPDGTYVGHTLADDNLVSYRLQVTIVGHKIASADFRELWDGFDYSPGIDSYIQQWIIDPARRATYLANEPTYVAQEAAAAAYDSQLVGLTSPGQLPAPTTNLSVYNALLQAWTNLLQLRLLVVQHVDETLGDNNNAPHTWNEYIPLAVQENPRKPVPLVLSLHGSGNSIIQQEGLDFPYLGATQDFITVIPDDSNNGNTYGSDGSWNVAPNPGSTQLSDADFLLALIQHEEATRAIDTTRVYLTGISNGAAMSSYLAMLHPDMFAGLAEIAGAIGTTGGSFNPTFTSQIDAVLAHNPTPDLPVVTGMGDEDQYNWMAPIRGQGPYSTANSGYQTQLAWWYTYNGMPQPTWDPSYPWGQPLQDNRTFDKYSFTIDTGTLPAPTAAGRWAGPALVKFYLVHQMFHFDPNPYTDVLSWNFLKHFRRLPTGRIVYTS